MAKPKVHFQVFIHEQWWDVPDDAVLRQPNLYGRTIVWPIIGHDYASEGGAEKIDIRCFIPGSMT